MTKKYFMVSSPIELDGLLIRAGTICRQDRKIQSNVELLLEQAQDMATNKIVCQKEILLGKKNLSFLLENGILKKVRDYPVA